MAGVIAYYRVSTDKQGRSGLGLEAQKAAVKAFAESRNLPILKAYTEIETAKRHHLENRPELSRALAHANRSKALLVVAKLDRLLRSTVVHSLLKTSGVDFVACDNPYATPLTLDILAAVNEDEVRRISVRTKEALAARKARGGLLGSHLPQCNKLTDEARRRGAQAAGRTATLLAERAYRDIVPDVRRMRQGGQSLRVIAEKLNQDGHVTRQGKRWNAMQVGRLLKMDRS